MTNFAVNVSTIFTEVPFIERFQKAKECGFTFVECQFPYSFSAESIQQELQKNEVTLVLINLPPGDWETGDRGLAVDPNRIEEFRASVESGINYASKLHVDKIHCMAGIIPPTIDKEEAREVYKNNLKYAADKMAECGIMLMIEPINSYDMPHYLLSSVEEAVNVITELALPNIKLQFDFYHVQRMHGNLMTTFQKHRHFIEHVQIADVPGRHQPGTGEINYKQIFNFLKEENYNGFVGLEYNPHGGSEQSFEWIDGGEKQ